ncbi:MAG TPA: LysR family transcriptional regulator [Phenylobacterium sp.]|jgi:DNA-binding transcriptional LysR family regulator|nr:LysR family transcriptional regulator [Phenylobacterium sp.]
MELRHLEQIVAIARCGGFSGAARQLHSSQSTLSKSISRLESQLSVKLFHRDGSGARPTSYGKFLAARGAGVLNDVEELTRDLARLIHGEKGRLRIGVGPAPSVRLLRQIVTGMSERFPDLAIKTAQDNASRLVRDLVNGMYDAVFVYFEAAAPFEDLVRIKVLESAYIAVVRPGHPALRGAALTPCELLQHRLAACPLGSAFADWVGPVSGPQAEHLHGFRSDSYELILDRVLEEDFVAIAPSFVFERDIKGGRLTELPITWDGVYECWMLTTRERWRAPELKALAEISRVSGREDHNRVGVEWPAAEVGAVNG